MAKFLKKFKKLLKIKNAKLALILVAVVFLFVFSIEMLQLKNVTISNPLNWTPDRVEVGQIEETEPSDNGTPLDIQEKDKSVYCSMANECPADRCITENYCIDWDNSNLDLSKCTKEATRCSISYSEASKCLADYLKLNEGLYPLFKYTKLKYVNPTYQETTTCSLMGVEQYSEKDLMCWSLPVEFKGLENTKFPFDKTEFAVGNKSCNVYFTSTSMNIFKIKDLTFQSAKVTVTKSQAWQCLVNFVDEHPDYYTKYENFSTDKLLMEDTPRAWSLADTSEDLLYYWVKNDDSYLPASITLIVGAHTCNVHSVHH